MGCYSWTRAGLIGAIGMGLLIGQTSTVTARPSASERHDARAQASSGVDPSAPATHVGQDTPPAEIAHTHSRAPQITPWQTMTVEPGDSLSRLFARANLPAREWVDLLKLGDPVEPLETLRAGETVEIRKTPGGRLAELQYSLGPVDTLAVRRTASGDDALVADIIQRQTETRRLTAQGVVDGSLSGSLAAAGVPAKIATELAHIYRYRADLSHGMQSGDRFSIIYDAQFADGHRIASGPIVAARITTAGTEHAAFRVVDDDGRSAYYDTRGRAYEPSFSRHPVNYSRISSPFNPNRMHPILHIRRPHWGVDMAAPRGTPIHAAANGVVKFVGRKHGYGRLVELQHADGYSSRYGHMARFVKGLHDGERVHEGDVIGYVGSTGEATGPHLHFEIRKDGIAHNPLTMPLPEGHPLSPNRLAVFVSRIQPLIARLDGRTGTTTSTLFASASDTQLRGTNCNQASAINAALALSPAHADDRHPLSELFCVVAAQSNA
ncbi:peptidoglycan DD-metalloendopeptidase family protein [Salinisphaera sp. T31B1]|uniref:peptidoglycan DD-metalloendopeptidase family protein n=1 Tax=Salinisphaera sp. T31B1 TaxID=727963 RepID=UPI00333FC3C4